MTPVAVNGDSASAAQSCWTGSNQMSTPTGYTTGCQPIGGVTSVALATTGSYTAPSPVPTVSFSGGGGSGAAATAVMAAHVVTNGWISSITVTTGGSGYTAAPLVSFSGGDGTGAVATASLGSSTLLSGYVNALSLTASGSG